jgi:predicted transcriptional regulator of viral defense system
MTHYQQLFEIAADNYGIVTSAQAKEEGISDKEMSAIASRGRIRRLGRGVYKIVDYIPVENDPYAEAVALVGPGAYLFGESVLAMLHLAPTNPMRITVATPRRVRKTLPRHIQVEPAPTDIEPTYYDGIPSESVSDAICTCRGRLMRERLLDATREARRQGYLTDEEKMALLTELSCPDEKETA